MSILCTKTQAEKLTANDVAALDLLLESYPGYMMVDDFRAVTKLLELEFIEAGVRMDGQLAQAVYRVTARGAEAYRMSQPVRKLDRVG